MKISSQEGSAYQSLCNAGIRLHNTIGFHNGHHVPLDNDSAINSCSVFIGRLEQNKFDSDQYSFLSLFVIRKEGQEMANHGYFRNMKEHIVGVVRPGKKIPKKFEHATRFVEKYTWLFFDS